MELSVDSTTSEGRSDPDRDCQRTLARLCETVAARPRFSPG